jgi:hypothetical protein
MDDEVAMETGDATQPTGAMDPVGVSQPAVAVDPAGVTQSMAGVEPADGTEPCAHCGALLARDQRYCLECGTPRTYLSGMLLERLRASTHGQPGQLAQEGAASGAIPNGSAGYGTAGYGTGVSSTWQRGNVLTLIAGIGVLLLAMGVGVLIGRSGGSSASNAPAPQVISVGGVGAGAASTSTTPTITPEATTPTTKSGSGSSTGKPNAKVLAPGVGSVPSKPAPPSVLKNLRKKSNGESFEQKSKNLPNVVETG